MRIYTPAVAQDANYEWALPVDDASGHDRLRIGTFDRVAATWSPVEMKLIEVDEGQALLPADFPWLGDHALLMRKAAAESVAPLVEGQGELLPLSCRDDEMWLLHVVECRDALVEHSSEVVKFSSGRIMTIRHYDFDPAALDGVRCFKIPQMPTGPMFLSGGVVDAIESANLTGFGADLVWDSDGSSASS